MRQIPELLFMTNTLETGDRNGVYTLNYKLYIESSLPHVWTEYTWKVMDATQTTPWRVHGKNGRSSLMGMRHRMKALAFIYQAAVHPHISSKNERLSILLWKSINVC